jgi:equilibrative nucleoside transporter 1/2/3
VFQKSPRTTGSSGLAHSLGSSGSHSAQTSLSSIEGRLGGLEDGMAVGAMAREFADVVASPSTSIVDRRGGPALSGALLAADAHHQENKPIPTCELISMIGRHCFSVCFVFSVTLSVFPAITSEIRSKSNLSNERCPESGRFPFGAGVWQALFFLIFNVGDTVGRLLAGLGRPFAAKHVVWVSLARVGFIPLFLLCTLASKSSGGKGPSPEVFYGGTAPDGATATLGFFNEDYWPVLFMAVMSISNGWVASLEMMAGPSLVPDGQQSRAGTIMAFFLVLGLVLGSVLSFGVRALACNCNPFLPQQ